VKSKSLGDSLERVASDVEPHIENISCGVAKKVSPSPEELFPMSNRQVIELLWSCWESICWSSRPASKLFREKAARQVAAGAIAPYVEAPSDKALGQSLGVSLRVEFLGNFFAR
jgi:hypothetical protein